MFHRPRWRRVSSEDLPDVAARLSSWDCPAGGEVRHMFALATIESQGSGPMRVAEDDDRWAACVVQPGQLVVPCGDAELIERVGVPTRRFRLVVGDAAACDALLGAYRGDPGMVVHQQRFQVVDPERVPDERTAPDPGLRRAEVRDIDALTDLAVQLHVDDDYGGHPGRSGQRGYRRRMERAVERGSVWVVGEVGDPLVKIERSVDSARYGVQLAGIVVRPRRRREGLGFAAVTASVRGAMDDHPGRPVALHVRADNLRALRVYERAGFVDREEWRLAVRS